MDSTLVERKAVWEANIYSGTWSPGGGEGVDVTDKGSGALIGRIGTASAEDIDRAVDRGRAAQHQWAATPGPLRGDVLRKAADVIRARADEIAAQIVRETGSIRAKGAVEVRMTAREITEAAALGSQPSGMIIASESPGRSSIARRVPIGLVGVITPWNSPVLLASRALAPALVMGNAVMLKPDQHSPVVGGALFAEIFEEAGLPEGLLHILPGGPDTGEALVRHPNVGFISFTGSTKVGRRIGELAGAMLKKTSLELGGNNALIVLDDVDIEAAASVAAWGSFFHQGQICMTSGRLIVHENIAEPFAAALARHGEALKVGDPSLADVQLGPIINERQAANVDRVVAASRELGARVLVGGTRDGLFYAPTVLADVRPGMPAFDEEIFGPVAPITSFATDEEAIEIANDTEYGLVAGVLAGDLTRARRIADRLHAGSVHINDQTIMHEVFAPMGGMGVSGNGFAYGALTNADLFTEWQWVTSRDQIARYPF
jgi:benzaldehyde dehydrogenase (NAD)